MNRRSAIIAGLAGVSAVAALSPEARAARKKTAEKKTENRELENVKALLKAHDEAMTNHDLKGVMATLADKAAIMGTGPGEIWSGPEEVKTAYEHFFEGFDKGQQEFEYHFKIGDLGRDMGWLMASGNMKGKKDGKDFEVPLNISLTTVRVGGQWKIAAMHFSTLTGPEPEKKPPAEPEKK